VAQASGFAAALLLGGALTEYAPWPTRLSFWLLAALLALLFAAAWFLPRGPVRAGGWRPIAPFIPANARSSFAVAAVAMMTAYTHGVLVLSLGGQVAHDLVESPNALVNGAVLSVFPTALGVTGVLCRRLRIRVAMTDGAVASAAGMALLTVSVTLQALPVLLLAMATAGVGYSLLFASALRVIDAPAEQRGNVLSALYLLAYFSLGAVAVGLGMVATAWGLAVAVRLGAGIIGVLSLGSLGWGLSRRD